MLRSLLIASIVLFQAHAFAQEAGPVLLAVMFDADEKSGQAAADIYAALCGRAQENHQYVIKKDDKVAPLKLPEGLKDDRELNRISMAAKDAGASFILLGRASSYPEGYAVEVCVMSTDGKTILYRTGCALSGTDAATAAVLLSGRIGLFIKKSPVPPVKECAATRGESQEKTTVSWEQSENMKEYAVYRSCFEQGPFLYLAPVEGTSYDDTGAEPGVQYWYAIGPVVDSVPCEPGKAAPGHRKIEPPAGRDLDRLIRERTKPLPVYKIEKDKKQAADHEAFLRGNYRNQVELAIVLNIIRSYVKKGAVTVLEGLSRYDINVEQREIMMVDEEYRYAVAFTSSRLVRIFLEAQLKSPDPDRRRELTDLLVRNMTAFCVYRNEITITDTENRTRIIPCYDALGVATELHKNCAEWKKHTMVFGTGNKGLEERIKQARKKEGK